MRIADINKDYLEENFILSEAQTDTVMTLVEEKAKDMNKVADMLSSKFPSLDVFLDEDYEKIVDGAFINLSTVPFAVLQSLALTDECKELIQRKLENQVA